MSLMMVTPNKPGALYNVLSCFNALGIKDGFYAFGNNAHHRYGRYDHYRKKHEHRQQSPLPNARQRGDSVSDKRDQSRDRRYKYNFFAC